MVAHNSRVLNAMTQEGLSYPTSYVSNSAADELLDK